MKQTKPTKQKTIREKCEKCGLNFRDGKGLAYSDTCDHCYSKEVFIDKYVLYCHKCDNMETIKEEKIKEPPFVLMNNHEIDVRLTANIIADKLIAWLDKVTITIRSNDQTN